MELIVGHAQQTVLTLASTRSSFFLKKCLSLRNLSALRTAGFHKTTWFRNRADGDNSSLTLSSLRFKCQVETGKKGKTVEIENTNLVMKVSPGEVKTARTSLTQKASGVKNVLEIDGAPFAAKSFSDLGLSSLLIDRLEKEGLTVPTDVQSSAIPTISKKHDVINYHSVLYWFRQDAFLLPILSQIGPLKKPTEGDQSEQKPGIEAVIVAPSRELGMQIVRK